MIRLQKYIANAGFCSRRKAEHYIQNGEVKVNDKVITQLGVKIDPDNDRVEIEGKTIRPDQSMVYIMLNKPKGYITSCRHGSRRIVMELVNVPQRVYPVGRLDKDSTGLLILTNDGRLHQQLSHPSFDHEKEYEVETAAAVADADLEILRQGVIIDGIKTRNAGIRRISPNRFRIVLQEGRKRQIRRMVESIGNTVISLHRVRVSGLHLGDLRPSQWRFLAEKEVRLLLKDVLKAVK